uniref:Putative transcription activator mbf2 n=1 Tax=Rhodnius prolixus TaxID=13249 RepID=A0A4P6DGV6_RHOPR
MFSTLLCLVSAVTLIHGFAVAFQECVRRNKEPLIIGSRVPGDSMVMNSVIGLTTNNGINEREVKWSNAPYKITRIQITDTKTDEKGGCAHITSGGYGMNFVSIHLQSPINGSSLFEINVYGIKDQIYLSSASSSSSFANYQWPILSSVLFNHSSLWFYS